MNTVCKHVNNLLTMDMRLWDHIPSLQKQEIYISIKASIEDGTVFEAIKDPNNNVYSYNLNDLKINQTAKSLRVRFLVPSSIKNTFEIQDIVASEIIQTRYRVIFMIDYQGYLITEMEAVFV